MDPKKVEAIVQWGSPTNIHDVRAFLGFANFYRRSIKRYSDIREFEWKKFLRRNLETGINGAKESSLLGIHGDPSSKHEKTLMARVPSYSSDTLMMSTQLGWANQGRWMTPWSRLRLGIG